MIIACELCLKTAKASNLDVEPMIFKATLDLRFYCYLCEIVHSRSNSWPVEIIYNLDT